ncbi:peptide-N4-(N-acetyl-beta-glucosaminyl)asparagine amidase A [Irpex rosettiformis]|uniref:Peptide-N4-(N-acetyl-beta-glucosaminyl)asparagine amidase A n=1 Tax=Irpex rosettiformis TaxID=378272 RepID=A0ACB8UGP1_9APHY|nr:peptide-N4-(N-acetyl-beta-glucosaminyl)asparagine amidase A [Irpex rosettiformis]
MRPTVTSILGLLIGLHRVTAARLVDFQVTQPLTLPKDAKQCTVKILERTFAFSYGSPEVVQYTPPIASDCGPAGSWAGISLNFTVTSNGSVKVSSLSVYYDAKTSLFRTQYDRLGIFTLDHVEIWRTSTPEPTRGDGIIWTYLKDVSHYSPLFAKPGTFVLQLDNLIQTGLDGEYATTLHATFYASSERHPPATHADLIVPITTLADNSGDVASVPPVFSLGVTLPRNIASVVAEITPSGNGNEEFWSMNVPDKYLGDLPNDITFGKGPFREVRLLVDGQVAGIIFPYLVVFTGGIAPTLWRPIAAYAALDLPTYYIDLTPFIPILADGKPHNISLDVLSAESDHSINQNWYVTANLQVTLDSSSNPTTGKMVLYSVGPYAHASTTGSVRSDGTVDFTVTATRDLRIESQIRTGSGAETHVVWTQSLSYSNAHTYAKNATVQMLSQSSSGKFLSTHNGSPALADTFSFPAAVNFTYFDSTLTNWTTSIDHSYNRALQSVPFIPGTVIQEHQVASRARR